MRFLQNFFRLSLKMSIFWVTFFVIYFSLEPAERSRSGFEKEERWIYTSRSWLDRTTCKWIAICGGTNWLGQTRLFRNLASGTNRSKIVMRSADYWIDDSLNPEDIAANWTEGEHTRRKIPQYILKHAPLVFLHPDEPYWPSDAGVHLQNVIAMYEDSVAHSGKHLTLSNISLLNNFSGGHDTFLTSPDDIQNLPAWIQAKDNRPVPSNYTITAPKPNPTHATEANINSLAESEGWFSVGSEGASNKQTKPQPSSDEYSLGDSQISYGASNEGYSPAPAVLIVINKEHDVQDAFWFYFNSFNQGNKVLGIRFGNHIGDWEHVSM